MPQQNVNDHKLPGTLVGSSRCIWGYNQVHCIHVAREKSASGEDGVTSLSQKKRDGRTMPPEKEKRCRELVTKWQAAKMHGVKQKDFCWEQNCTVQELERIINTLHKRDTRKHPYSDEECGTSSS